MSKWINQPSGYGKLRKKRPRKISSSDANEYESKGYKIYNSYSDAKGDCD